MIRTAPYLAAQKICSNMVEMTNLKIENLDCLKKHVIQLSNAIAVLIKNRTGYKSYITKDLKEVSALLSSADNELTRSQRIGGGQVVFDWGPFDQAQAYLIDVSKKLNPDSNGTSILDLTNALTMGAISDAYATKENMVLSLMSVRSLIYLIQQEAAAYRQHVAFINSMVDALRNLSDQYQRVVDSSKVRQMRAQLIADLKNRIASMKGQIDSCVSAVQKPPTGSAVAKQLQRATDNGVSGMMLLWSSRAKSMVVMMDYFRQAALSEGSPEDLGQTAYLDIQLDKLLQLLSLISTQDGATQAGIEDPLPLFIAANGICNGAIRFMKDLESDYVSDSNLATFHALVANSASAQGSSIDLSSTVASNQKAACSQFLQLEIQGKESYQLLLDTAKQLNLDRGYDLLSIGEFSTFMETDVQSLSYLGATITCLTETINGLDDVQTRQTLSAIRDDMIAKQKNQDIAAADSSLSGVTRYIDGAKSTVQTIRRNAETVKSIVKELEAIYQQLDQNAELAEAGIESFLTKVTSLSQEVRNQYGAFKADRDKFAVAAGGRLADDAEELAAYPFGGVPQC
jgi:hypothetical protein